MPTLYIRDVPRDLYTHLKKIRKELGCKTWITFLYEVSRRVARELEEEGRILD